MKMGEAHRMRLPMMHACLDHIEGMLLKTCVCWVPLCRGLADCAPRLQTQQFLQQFSHPRGPAQTPRSSMPCLVQSPDVAKVKEELSRLQKRLKAGSKAVEEKQKALAEQRQLTAKLQADLQKVTDGRAQCWLPQ